MIASKRPAAPKGIRQAQRIYQFMVWFAGANDGLTPTTRQIEQRCNFATNSAPAMYLQRLRDAGAVVMLPGGRRYRLTGASWAGPDLGISYHWTLGPYAYGVMEYMIKYKQQTAGISPTVREIARELGIPSSAIVHDAWKVLTGAGWLMPAGRMMGFKIKGGKWTPPPADIIEFFSGKA